MVIIHVIAWWTDSSYTVLINLILNEFFQQQKVKKDSTSILTLK